jgi:dihydrofolate reductase
MEEVGMRKVLAAAFVSLDGVMQAPGGPEEDPTGGFEMGGWTVTYWDEVMGQAMGQSFAAPFDLLLGRKTYEIFAAHWPHMGDDPIAQTFNSITKYVVTSSTAPLAWRNSTALHDPVAEVTRLKGEDGPTLLTQGSSQLLQTLIARGLVDRFQVWTFPVVLGRGKRLFGETIPPFALNLTETKVSTTGVTMSQYVPTGLVPVGSFALEQPTEAELARRERMAREG